MVQDRRFALLFRFSSLLFAIIGFLAMLGIFSGEPIPIVLAYYTMLSNILAIVLFSLLTIRTATSLRESSKGNVGFFPRFEMVCTVDIMLTFVVYWVLLAPNLFTMVAEHSLWTFDNLAVHGITPLLCLLDYILFTQPRHLKYQDVFYVCIFPLAYLAVTSIAGLLGFIFYISPSDGGLVRFPYFFYDFDRIGMVSLVYIGALVVFFLLVGHVFYVIDRNVRKTRG